MVAKLSDLATGFRPEISCPALHVSNRVTIHHREAVTVYAASVVYTGILFGGGGVK
jgi:hypothetical protein